jgi:hypothetical protein
MAGNPRDAVKAQLLAGLRWTAEDWDAAVGGVRDAAARALADLAESLGLDPSHLDREVHDLAQEAQLDELNTIEEEDEQEHHISAVGAYGSNVNNGGLGSQIEFLIDLVGVAETEKIIRRVGEGEE